MEHNFKYKENIKTIISTKNTRSEYKLISENEKPFDITLQRL